METGSLTVDRKQTIASRMFEEVQSRDPAIDAEKTDRLCRTFTRKK